MDGTQSTFAAGLCGIAALAFQSVPEPSFLALLAVGAAAFLVRHRWQSVKKFHLNLHLTSIGRAIERHWGRNERRLAGQ